MRCLWEISIRFPLREISQRPLRNISKKVSFLWRLWDVSKTSQKRCLLRDVFKTSLKHLSQVFLVFQKYVKKMILWCDFRRLITMSDKKDVRPSETLKKWNVLLELSIDINQSSLPSGSISTWEFWQVKDLQNPIVTVLFTTFSDFFQLIKLYITSCHYELF